ncbi:MAG: dockerin type I domain-containing protein [Dehalococcoidia bacterium]
MRRALALAIAALATAAWLGLGSASQPAIERVSVSTAGTQGTLDSVSAAVNGDGRYVAFASDSTTLVPNDTNSRDVFVRDRMAGTTTLVDAFGGVQANRPAVSPSISSEGQQVVFESEADNLVPADMGGFGDIFLRDFITGTIARVSVSSGGEAGNDDSMTPSISGNGRFVTFTSLADNLAPDDANTDRDVFVRDRLMFTTELASVATSGTHGNFASGGLGAGPARISSDGRYVVYGSFANNLVPDDGNGRDDAFIRDRETGVTERVSVSSEETEGSGHSYYPSTSDDGRYVVFFSDAEDLVPDDSNMRSDVFLRDRQLGTTGRLSNGMAGQEANGASSFPVISAGGRFVAFQSSASNLVPNDSAATDIFLLDRDSGVIERRTSGGGASTTPAISADGAVVAFQSTASDLVPNDSNMRSDVFVWGKPLTPPIATGDANCSGRVDSIDAALILQLAAGLVTGLACQQAADVNASGVIDAIDAALVLQYAAGILPSLPP